MMPLHARCCQQQRRPDDIGFGEDHLNIISTLTTPIHVCIDRAIDQAQRKARWRRRTNSLRKKREETTIREQWGTFR
jgi:hypothetical protein